MKIVQTLWTRPGLHGGWLDQRFHFFSWALSCLQLRKYYNEVELYTDTLGKQLLVDTFGLPYTKVHVVLDDFPYPDYLWAAPKLKTYGLQEQPFLHVDGDVFIFHPFNTLRTQQNVVYQNREVEQFAGAFYTDIVNDINQKTAKPLPQWLNTMEKNAIVALNAGVYGGLDVPFFQEHAAMAFNFFDDHATLIANMKHPSNANHIAEQALAAWLLQHHDVKVHAPLFTDNLFLTPDTMHLVNNIVTDDVPEREIGDEPVPFGYQALNHFGISPLGRKYVHLMGHNKKSKLVCALLARRLRKDFPSYFDTINNYFVPGEKAQVQTFLKEKVFRQAPHRLMGRTVFLASVLEINAPSVDLPLDDYLVAWQNTIHALPEEDRARMQDVFNLECERLQYAKESLETKDLYAAEGLTANSMDLLPSPEEALNTPVRLSLNPVASLQNVQWNWTDTMVYTKDFPPINPTTIALLQDYITGAVMEIDLTNYTLFVCEVAQQHMLYADALQRFTATFPFDHEAEAARSFFQCVTYLIVNGIIHVQP
ncbi:hypothetical protein LX64_00972 [Chitinophaga skermanii]|uniref:DUF6734 domain-containing protein n=1 Tax=Chitinophaga skermanii TaxID=331697 RepID=A0A327QX70_9BACT|nr:DUF6734 family protein [Chitinophaga skermanii]RAJ08324.1 hypothetical protein LX64_00972 [Chitinophaga skermanii]